jgi:hypothetical protein
VNRIALTIRHVIFANLLAKSRCLDPHKGINDGVKSLGTIEDLQSDVVGLQPVIPASQSLIDDIL